MPNLITFYDEILKVLQARRKLKEKIGAYTVEQSPFCSVLLENPVNHTALQYKPKQLRAKELH